MITEAESDMEFLTQNIAKYFENSNIKTNIKYGAEYNVTILFDKNNLNETLHTLTQCANKFQDDIRILAIKHCIQAKFEINIYKSYIKLTYKI